MADCVFSKLPNGEGEISGLRVNVQQITLGTYATGGFAIGPGKVAMGNLHGVQFLGWDTSGQGYVPQWNFETGKLMIFETAPITPAGTVAAPVFTGESYTPAGTISAGVIPVTAGTAGDAVTNNAGVLESTGGQDLTVNAQTFTGTAHTLAGTNSAPAFTGTASSKAPLAEVANSTDLTALRGRFMFIGY